MPRLLASLFIYLLFQGLLPAQKVIYNFDIHQDWPHFEEVVNLWSDFLAAPDDSSASQYWNNKELKKYGRQHYFLLNSEYNPPLRRMAQAYRVQILQISERDSLYKITSQFYYPQGDTLHTLCIIEVYAGREAGEFKLFNAGPINRRRHWQSRQLGYLNYHFPSHHQFDGQKAALQNDFISDSLPRLFGSTPDTVDYFLASSLDEMNRMRGFLFNVGGSGSEKATGKAQAKLKAVYAVGTGEYYPHELIHIFVDPLFSQIHPWASEGLATYLGGSRGHELPWHINRSHRYLQEHPEVNLNEMLKLLTLDEYTDYRYVLGGTIISLIHERHGWQGVKEFLREAKSDETYYLAIKKQLGWPQDKLNDYLRKELARLANS